MKFLNDQASKNAKSTRRNFMQYQNMTKAELAAEKDICEAAYRDLAARGLSLDLSRGKPAADQLDLSMEMLSSAEICAGKTDCRSYPHAGSGCKSANYIFALVEDDCSCADETYAGNYLRGNSSNVPALFFSKFYSVEAVCRHNHKQG